MTSTNKPEGYRTNIRLSIPMSEWVKDQANKHFRSFNGEIVELVRKAMTDEATPVVVSNKNGHTPETFHGTGCVTSLWSNKAWSIVSKENEASQSQPCR